PINAPTVNVRFTASSMGMKDLGAWLQVGGSPRKSLGNTTSYSGAETLPAEWPRVTVTVGYGGTVSAIGDPQRGEYVEATRSATLTLTDGSAPVIIAAPAVKENRNVGSGGYEVTFTGKVKDHTSGISHVLWQINYGGWNRQEWSTAPRAEGDWALTVNSGMRLGLNHLTTRFEDRAGNATTHDLEFMTKDETAPVLEITEPKKGLVMVQGPALRVRGTVSDAHSGVARVDVKVDGGAAQRATVDAAGGWSVDVPISGLGYHGVEVTALDGSGLATTRFSDVQLVSGYKPKTVEELLSPRAYLDALLGFAYEHLDASGRPPAPENQGRLSTTRLEEVFRQPFGKLREPLSDLGARPVSTTRLVAETLRRHLLAGQWAADETSGTLLADRSGNGNHGSVAAQVGRVDGKVGKALAFAAGGDASVAIPHSPSLEIGAQGADFSVALWLWVNAASPDFQVVARKGDVDTQRTFGIYVLPNTRKLHYRVSTTEYWNEGNDSTASLALNAWNHVALVKRGGELRLYLNGVFDSLATLRGPTIGNAGTIWIGKDPWTPSLNGKVDDLRIYQAALGDAAIAALAKGAGDADEAAYRMTAYDTLLARLGTTYEEIRLARRAPAAVRDGLALRLGIAAGDLDRLYHAPGEVTEAWLEEVFGFLSTTRPDPLLPPSARPWLATAREARQR
ncbi:MAG TPA: LamG-like jellyroll fold domain-containing protein, partial [Longimicrobium sp.]|nr:LamG-like jellyroll fold domain-containing protein [Longimicrobium sp.]